MNNYEVVDVVWTYIMKLYEFSVVNGTTRKVANELGEYVASYNTFDILTDV